MDEYPRWKDERMTRADRRAVAVSVLIIIAAVLLLAAPLVGIVANQFMSWLSKPQAR